MLFISLALILLAYVSCTKQIVKAIRKNDLNTLATIDANDWPHLKTWPYLEVLKCQNCDRNVSEFVCERIGLSRTDSEFLKACWKGNYDVVSGLLKYESVDPSVLTDSFLFAIDSNQFEIAHLLVQDGRADPSLFNNGVLIWASENGQKDLVLNLVQDKRVNAHDFCKASEMASKNGHVNILKLFLELRNLDAYSALCAACEFGQRKIVKFLLHNLEFDSTEITTPLKSAISHGYEEIVKLLLNYPNYKPSKSMTDYVVNGIAEEDRLNMLEIVIKYPMFSPRTEHNAALCYAVRNNNVQMVKLLLQNYRRKDLLTIEPELSAAIENIGISVLRAPTNLKLQNHAATLNSVIEMNWKSNENSSLFLAIKKDKGYHRIGEQNILLKDQKFVFNIESLFKYISDEYFKPCKIFVGLSSFRPGAGVYDDEELFIDYPKVTIRSEIVTMNPFTLHWNANLTIPIKGFVLFFKSPVTSLISRTENLPIEIDFSMNKTKISFSENGFFYLAWKENDSFRLTSLDFVSTSFSFVSKSEKNSVASVMHPQNNITIILIISFSVVGVLLVISALIYFRKSIKAALNK